MKGLFKLLGLATRTEIERKNREIASLRSRVVAQRAEINRLHGQVKDQAWIIDQARDHAGSLEDQLARFNPRSRAMGKLYRSLTTKVAGYDAGYPTIVWDEAPSMSDEASELPRPHRLASVKLAEIDTDDTCVMEFDFPDRQANLARVKLDVADAAVVLGCQVEELVTRMERGAQ